MASDCFRMGIPDHLHKNGRDEDSQFQKNEKLYRRFNISPPKNTWLNSREKSAAVFRLNDDSYNRDKYSRKPNEVLFNIRAKDKNDHFFNHGILELNIQRLNSKKFNNIKINGQIAKFRFLPKHVPEICMYPHCEIHAFQGDEKVNPVSSKSARAIIRDIFVELCDIIKNPD